MANTVLYIDQNNYYGGGQKITFSVLKYLRNNGWNVVVMFPEGGNLQSIAQKENYSYIKLPILNVGDGKKKIRDYLRYFINEKNIPIIINKVIKEYRCDIIYTLSPRLLKSIYISSKSSCIPIIFHFHMLYQNFIWELYLKYYLRKSSLKKIIVLSDYCNNWLKKNVIISDKTIVINNWVVESEFSDKSLNKIILPSNIPRSFKFAVIGRILPIKGQKYFLEAALRQCESEDCTEYYIIGDTNFGDDGYKKALQEILNKSLFKTRIHFVPFIESISFAYNFVDCIVVPSVWGEPFGLVAVEAMFFKKYLIISNTGELPNIVGNGKYASIVNVNDPNDLLQKMNKVLSNSEINSIQIEDAKKWVESRYHSAEKLTQLLYEFNKLV